MEIKLKIFHCHKMEYDFFEEDVQLSTETEEEEDSKPMNLLGIELEESDEVDDDEEFDVDDMSEMARQSENNADTIANRDEY